RAIDKQQQPRREIRQGVSEAEPKDEPCDPEAGDKGANVESQMAQCGQHRQYNYGQGNGAEKEAFDQGVIGDASVVEDRRQRAFYKPGAKDDGEQNYSRVKSA